MSRGEVQCGFILILSTLYILTSVTSTSSRIRQRSDGCGPHPLIALVAALRTPGSGTTSPTLNEIIRAVRADPDVWSDLQDLLRRYDDCIRAGDGLHFKRASELIID